MKLTDKQKKEIIAEYVSGTVSQRELAKRYQVTQKTISKILNDEKVYQKVSELENENTLSMLAYLDSKRGFAQELIGEALSSVKSKLAKASLKDTITAIKSLSEVFKDSHEESEAESGVNVEIVIRDCGAESVDEESEEEEEEREEK